MSEIKNKNLIPFDERYEFAFCDFSVENCSHPVNNFYYKLDDLSINLNNSLKWAIWSYLFLINIPKELNDLEETFLIQKSINSPILFPIKKKQILLLDDSLINDENEFINLMNTNYNDTCFDKNSKVHFKLKLNLDEFLRLNFEIIPSFLRKI